MKHEVMSYKGKNSENVKIEDDSYKAGPAMSDSYESEGLKMVSKGISMSNENLDRLKRYRNRSFKALNFNLNG